MNISSFFQAALECMQCKSLECPHRYIILEANQRFVEEIYLCLLCEETFAPRIVKFGHLCIPHPLYHGPVVLVFSVISSECEQALPKKY